MAESMPDWFKADRVFQGRNGWHVGSPSGLSVGPYSTEAEAARASREACALLERSSDPQTRAERVREFVRDHTSRILETDPAANVISVRAGERSKVWVRKSRFFNVDNAWFFHTREGIDVGPYHSKDAVERDAARLIEILKTLTEEPEAGRRSAIFEFMRRSEVA